MRHDPAVAATRRAVRAAIADLPSGATVFAAVSGGADSLALAAALAHEARRAGIKAGAATVDHQLQDGSAQRAAHVAEQCKTLGLDPVHVLTVTVKTRGGPEAAARNARYEALRELGAPVLLGHTLDDQAETVLLGLARGSGPRSLAGMRPVDGWRRRPFLGIRRAETTAACRALGLDTWDDPHNTDARFLRTKVRHEALPALENALGPDVADALARTADLVRADADLLDELAAKAATIDLAELAALPDAICSRVLRTAAIEAGAPASALTAAHVRQMQALVRGTVSEVSLPGGLVARRRYGRLSLR